jgi:hypothetical protein
LYPPGWREADSPPEVRNLQALQDKIDSGLKPASLQLNESLRSTSYERKDSGNVIGIILARTQGCAKNASSSVHITTT